MLPAAHRIRRRDDFTSAIRAGQRVSRATLVLHYLPSGILADPAPARVGFVVNRAVGNAVTRNRVGRRLREIVRGNLHRLPPGAVLVVRALPAAAGARSSLLRGDLEAALDRLQGGSG
jgi:ribonuclease P protein component